MYKLSEFVTNELLQNSRVKTLSLIKLFLQNGNKNATLLIRIFLASSKKKDLFNRFIVRALRNRLIKVYGIEIGGHTKIGMGLHIAHPNGIIFGEGVEIGKNVTIYHQVTFGLNNVSSKGDINAYPKVGDNCIIYAGAKIIGNIKLGNGTIVGANSVLLTDTEENSVYAGIPAKRIK